MYLKQLLMLGKYHFFPKPFLF